jgi:hypothetical protein
VGSPESGRPPVAATGPYRRRCLIHCPTEKVRKSLRLPLEVIVKMARRVAMVLYLLAMAAIIVGVDFAFFRNRFWERLMVNIGIVLVFIAFYLRFLQA